MTYRYNFLIVFYYMKSQDFHVPYQEITDDDVDEWGIEEDEWGLSPEN